jgi:hypothetical protein
VHLFFLFEHLKQKANLFEEPLLCQQIYLLMSIFVTYQKTKSLVSKVGLFTQPAVQVWDLVSYLIPIYQET